MAKNDTSSGQLRILSSLKGTPLDVSVTLAGKRVPIGTLVGLSPGSILSFDVPSSTPAKVAINGKELATGKVVRIDDNYGIEVTAVVEGL